MFKEGPLFFLKHFQESVAKECRAGLMAWKGCKCVAFSHTVLSVDPTLMSQRPGIKMAAVPVDVRTTRAYTCLR